MISRTATIRNRNGIHVRPSKVIAAAVADYTGSITIRKDSYTIDRVNAMNLLSMGLIEGDTIEITVAGDQEAQVADNLVDLFETRFDFPPRS